MSLAQEIITAVTARLSAIPGMSGRVSEWSPSTVPDRSLPLIVVRDSRVTVEAVEMGHRLMMDIEVDIVAADQPAEVRRLTAAVITAVGTDPQWGGRAMMTTWQGSELLVDRSSGIIAGAVVRIQIMFRVREWQPGVRL